MEHDITIRLELQLPAMKIMHHLQTHNEQVEGEIKKGVQLAIDEISNDGFLANKVRLAVLNAIDRSMMWSLTEYKITDEVNKTELSLAIQIKSSIFV